MIVGDFLPSNNDTGGHYAVDNVITHPSNGLALIMLATQLEWTDDVMPACLPQEAPLAGLTCTKNNIECEYFMSRIHCN